MSNDTEDRLARIESELAEVLEQRLGVLADALASSERVTRRIIAAEVEIERYDQSRNALGDEMSTLEQQVGDDRKRCETMKTDLANLQNERNQLRDAAVDLDRDLEDTRADVERMRGRVGALESEADSLVL